MQFRPITCYQIRGTQQLWQSDVPAGGKTTIKTFPPQGRDVCVRARLHVFVLFFLFHTLTEDKLKWNQCWTVTLINSTSVLYMNMSIFLLLANDSPPNITLVTLLLLAVTHHYWYNKYMIHQFINSPKNQNHMSRKLEDYFLFISLCRMEACIKSWARG